MLEADTNNSNNNNGSNADDEQTNQALPMNCATFFAISRSRCSLLLLMLPQRSLSTSLLRLWNCTWFLLVLLLLWPIVCVVAAVIVRLPLASNLFQWHFWNKKNASQPQNEAHSQAAESWCAVLSTPGRESSSKRMYTLICVWVCVCPHSAAISDRLAGGQIDAGSCHERSLKQLLLLLLLNFCIQIKRQLRSNRKVKVIMEHDFKEIIHTYVCICMCICIKKVQKTSYYYFSSLRCCCRYFTSLLFCTVAVAIAVVWHLANGNNISYCCCCWTCCSTWRIVSRKRVDLQAN